MADTRHPTPRERPAKAPLSREAVVAAGLGVLREHGIDGVTMRAVAGTLDTGPASLYAYFPNRQALLDAMFDAVAATIDLSAEPDPARWREQLVDYFTRVVAAMDAHPGIARVPLANPPTGPHAAAASEHLLRLLAVSGVDERSIAWFVDIAFLFVNATAYETAIYVADGTDEHEFDEKLRSGFAELSSEDYPTFMRLMPLLTSGNREERFAFGLDLLINGLLHTEPPAV